MTSFELPFGRIESDAVWKADAGILRGVEEDFVVSSVKRNDGHSIERLIRVENKLRADINSNSVNR